MPSPKVPKVIKKREEESEMTEEAEEPYTRRAEIEEELIIIQQKLRALNG